jgi:23S rRNA pseudouridine2605 synthase
MATSEEQKGERIAKRLSRAGIASRRAAEAMIAEGRVAVNGRVIDSPALNVLPTDRIAVDGRPLPEAEAARLWRYHKPVGLITTARDERGRPTVFENLPPDLPRVMSVGRLDITSEGLLLLTNDGALKSRLESPATGWTRRYRVRAMGSPDEAALEPLRRGITVEGERFRPMTVTLDRQQGANVWLTLGLKEGRYREVRRALGEIGLTVNRLIRISYGPFQLGDLAPGAVEEVKPRVLRDQLGLPAEAPSAPKRPGARPDAGPARSSPRRTATKKGGPKAD